jgi:putative DNA primase/helicase
LADGRCFDETGKFVPARAADVLRSESSVLLGHDCRRWRYESGVYRPDGDHWARMRLRQLVGDRFRRNQLEEVSAHLRAQLPSLGHTPPLDMINCANGLLDWATGTLKPHSAAVLSTNQVPVPWKPEAVAPTVQQFFLDVFPTDAVSLVEEICGYALYPGNPFQKAVLLLGPGENGKGTFLRLLTRLLGDANVSSISLQSLTENRFVAADLFGRLANLCGDLDARAIQHTDIFKQVTGGDRIVGERKFKDTFAFTPYALLIFAANEPPRVSDQTPAWFRRWLVLPMERCIAPDKIDPHLDAKLAAEIEGLFVLAVRGLQRLVARGRFVNPPSVERAGARYRETLDSVQGFLTEEAHFHPNAWVDRAETYKRYRTWCQDGGRLPVANTQFNAKLVSICGPRIQTRKRNGRPGWLGLREGPDPLTGDVGDVSPSSNHDARKRWGKVENASPTSPISPRLIDKSGDALLALDDDRDTVLELAGRAAYPRVLIRPGVFAPVEAGAAGWQHFVARATPEDIAAARSTLEALPAVAEAR